VVDPTLNTHAGGLHRGFGVRADAHCAALGRIRKDLAAVRAD
jgi:hypothetical protein